MAEGGEDPRRFERENHPLDRRPTSRRKGQRLKNVDIGNQARALITGFISERASRDGVSNTPEPDNLVEPGTPTGPPVDNVSDVAKTLRRIGDELDSDYTLQRLIQHIEPKCSEATFRNVARHIFYDGVYNWGRVVALFYFAYKMAVKAIQETVQMEAIQIIRRVIEWVVSFIVDHVAGWIIERGGWEAIYEYYGPTNSQFFAILAAGIICCTALYLWKKR